MDKKKIQKSIGRFFGWLGLSFCSLIIKILPQKWLYGFSAFIAGMGYRIAAKQRKIAQDSLKTAFGAEKSAQEIEKIARDCFTFMAKAGAEIIYLMDKPGLIKRRVHFVGREHLDRALSRGRGVILVSGHFGNFPLLMAKLSVEGYPTYGIMRPMRDTRVEKLFLSKRDLLGIKTIYSQPRKACVEETLRSLRNNALVFIPMDQNFGTAGVFVDFFGKKAATAIGPVVLARRTKAALLPCFIVRQSDDTHKLIFEPELEIKGLDNREENITLCVQQITGTIEHYIRLYPAEWGWIHRRWKSRPKTEEGGV